MSVLDTALNYLRSEIAPRANGIDADPVALGVALDGLCQRELMALRRPSNFGGPALRESEFREFQEAVARYSGCLAFLQTQHQSAGSMIAKSGNDSLKLEYLPTMGNGERLLGIGFSQLRRAGPPIMRAERIEGGYRLNGNVPWITGFGFFGEFVIGAALEDGQAVFGVIPFSTAPGLSFSEPMKLCSMEAARTVTADVSDWFLSDDLVVFVQPDGWIQNNDMINITLQGHFAIGCARAGLDVLESVAAKKKLGFIQGAFERLLAEWTDCREQTITAQGASASEKLRVRAWATELAVRCAHAAVVASSGAANSLNHPAQRIYREALVFSVSAQTGDIMEATLNRLTRVDD